MYFDQKYKNTSFGYPSGDLHPDMKGKEWHLKTAQAFYSSFINNNTVMSVQDYEEILRGRQYGAGKQDPEMYKSILIGQKELGDEERKAWMNVNFKDLVNVAPKFRRIIIGIFESQEHEVMATATDEHSNMDREDMKWMAWARKMQADFLKTVKDFTGNENPDEEYVPESMEELELYGSMRGFKLKTEVALEGGLSFVDYDSSWRMIKQKLVGDAIDCGKMMVKDYTDIASKCIKKRYVDPYNSFYTLDENGEVSKFGEVRFYTIPDVRRETGMSEEQLQKVALTFRGNFSGINNPYFEPRFNQDGSININYDDFLVPVLEFEVATNDVAYRTERKLKGGETGYFSEPVRTSRDGKLIAPRMWDTDNKKTSSFPVKVFRKGKWIIGTDEIWDWGLQYDMPRPNMSGALSSYHVEKIDGASLMVGNIIHFDQIQLAHLRIQNALAMAPNAGIAYEYASIGGMTLGGKGMSEMDIIKMHRQTGSVLYKATTHRGGMISPTSARPFLELKGGIGPLLDELVNIINLNLESVRANTGINQIMDASTPNPEIGLGISRMAVASTNNSLKPIYTHYLNIKEKSTLNCAMRLQIFAKYHKKYRTYNKVLGTAAWQVLEEGADFTMAEMGIKIQALPTEQQIQEINMALEKAIQAGRDGTPSLTMSEYFSIKRILYSGGGLKLAQVMLAYREQKNFERQQLLQQQNMQLNSQAQERQLQIKLEAEQQGKLIDAQIEKEKITHETDENIRLAGVTHQYKLEEIIAQKSMETNVEIE